MLTWARGCVNVVNEMFPATVVLKFIDPGSYMELPLPPENPKTWQEVLNHLFDRYLFLAKENYHVLSARVTPVLTDKVINLSASAITIMNDLPEDKANRWLGFVQGVMIAGGVLDIEYERDYTRPLFHSVKGFIPRMGPN